MVEDMDKPRGFSGLSSLVSNPPVESLPLDGGSTNVAGEAGLKENQYVPPAADSQGNSRKVWIIGAAILGIVVLANLFPSSPKKEATSSSSSYNSVSQAPTFEPMRPPEGTDLALNSAQIAYCLLQEIKISAMEKQVNDRSNLHIRNFNSYVQDFNSRCAKYRYLPSEMTKAKTYADSKRYETELAAQQTVNSWR